MGDRLLEPFRVHEDRRNLLVDGGILRIDFDDLLESLDDFFLVTLPPVNTGKFLPQVDPIRL